MENNQTAVDWIISKLHLRLLTIQSEPNGIVRETMLDNLLIDLEQAKAMEKEQIDKAFKAGWDDGTYEIHEFCYGKIYYEKTYGTN